jgi:tetratricopeptide (TPR) repeat protein
MDKGNNTQAGNEFGEVMKIDDKRWRTLNGIGILFAMKNRDEDAQAYYQAALAQSPDNPSVLNNIGLAYAMDKQYDRAFESFNHAKQHLPNNSPFLKRIDLNMALVYAITGDLDQAEQTAAPYLSKAALYNNMATYAHLAKNDDLAKSYLNMALTQSPVYYERAWKNLSAMNGEFSDESNANDNKPVARVKLPSKDDSQPTPAAAGITLDEIPESKSKAE